MKCTSLRLAAIVLLVSSFAAAPVQAATTGVGNPVVFVTQMPLPEDFGTVNSVFGNHLPNMDRTPRGGDLWIRYADGRRRNLTAAAGLGRAGLQGATAIAVRDPAVSWDGTKLLFSMVVGAPTQQYQVQTYFWQLYEMSNFGPGQKPVVNKVLRQPTDANNISPIYGSDDNIIFTTDRPFRGRAYLYPQLDEYESAPVVSGLWKLIRATGALVHLDHSPSGDYEPFIDSYGRLVFSRWDHLQRDQQADADDLEGGGYGTFDYSGEGATSTVTNRRVEVFPEPRSPRTDLLQGTPFNGHTFNFFLPWMMREDGTEMEALNHIGRQELQNYIQSARHDDPAVVDFFGPGAGRANQNPFANFLQIVEDPTKPGSYWGTEAPEFSTHASGPLVALYGPPHLNADQMTATYLTPHQSLSDNPPAGHPGMFRDPLPLKSGGVLAVHAPESRSDRNTGNTANPQSLYDFQIKLLKKTGGSWKADQPLTGPIYKTVSFWNPDTLVTYSNVKMWQLQPVEVVARTKPTVAPAHIPAPEQQIFDEEGVNAAEFRDWLQVRNLALAVSRNVTIRDDADRVQPFNLSVPGGVQTKTGNGKVYPVQFLQILQADMIRGLRYYDSQTPRPGRRALARTLHDANARAANPQGAPVPGGAEIAPDGSVAAFVPAQRALTWQLTDAAGTPVVRERFWLTLQPGEVRVCASCHGVNDQNQAGGGDAVNPPEALRNLLRYWKTQQG